MWKQLVLRSILLATPSLAFLPASASAACSNEVLRSELHSGQLPDCRAYELVTPAYKEETFMSSLFAISQDGSRILGASVGVFQGTEGDNLGIGTNLLGATYELSRTEGGWTAASLDPPASRYRSNGFFDSSADLTGTLWELGIRASQPEGVTDFYIEHPRGTFVRLGPATPDPNMVNEKNYAYLGGSEDLSHILFSTSEGFHWPFDATVGPNTLYEYVGTGTEPALVGVSGVAGSTQLVSKCGTLLGSSVPVVGGGSVYNAVSANGERIFFTAVGEDDNTCGASQPPVDELFAREEDRAEGVVRTVAISQPSIGHCSENPSPPCADAHFEGASEDGSKVFFLTEQELLPGAQGQNLYEYDFGKPEGGRLTLVSEGAALPEVQGVARISEDGSHVYFVAKGALTRTANSLGDTATGGFDNLYVYSEGHTSFIARLSSEDDQPHGEFQGDWARADNRPVLASRDGRFLIFTSQADLTHEQVNGTVRQVFQYDAETKGLARASIGQNGYNSDGRTPVYDAQIVTHPPSSYEYARKDSPTQVDGILASEDGAVFFTSPGALTPQALNDQTDSLGQPAPNVYEYLAGQVYLVSDGRDVSTVKSFPGVRLIGSDASGGNMFFTTSDPLVTQDTDTQQDVYDARVGGGFPLLAGSPGCLGEVCRGAPGTTPVLPNVGSAVPSAEEVNAPAKSVPMTPKGKIKRKTIKRKHRGRGRAKRAEHHSHARVGAGRERK
jgi:hypothetical protein